MKLLFSIILTTSLFAQDKSNQNSDAIDSYAIETTSQYYQDVSLNSVVYGIQVEVYDRRLNTTLNIPIADIKSLKKNGLRPNMIATFIGTAAGAGCVGAFAALFARIMFSSQDNPEEVVIALGECDVRLQIRSSISRVRPSVSIKL